MLMLTCFTSCWHALLHTYAGTYNCGDLVFSGHMLMLTCFTSCWHALLLLYYRHIQLRRPRVLRTHAHGDRLRLHRRPILPGLYLLYYTHKTTSLPHTLMTIAYAFTAVRYCPVSIYFTTHTKLPLYHTRSWRSLTPSPPSDTARSLSTLLHTQNYLFTTHAMCPTTAVVGSSWHTCRRLYLGHAMCPTTAYTN
jgi:hypothetical protein